MRVAIFGCGIEGSALAGGLATEPAVEALILVSRDGKRAEELRQRIAGRGLRDPGQVSCRASDATDERVLADALDGAGIVVNAALPDSNLPVMRACLEVGAHYLDMVTFGFESPGIPREQTLDASLELDEDFRGGDLVAVPNTGAAPGLTDVVARYLATTMDETDSAVVGWADRSDARELIPPFSPDLVYLVCMPSPRAWRDGRLQDVDLFESMEDFDWPEPLGRMTMVVDCLGPETRTLQYVAPGLRNIEARSALAIGRWGSWSEIWLEGVRRLLESDSVPDGASTPEWLASGFRRSSDYAAAIESGIITENSFGIYVSLIGTAGGVPVTRTMTVHTTLDRARAEVPWSSAMAHLTAQSTPREIILMLSRGELPERGVVPSNGVLSGYGQILEGCRTRGFSIQES